MHPPMPPTADRLRQAIRAYYHHAEIGHSRYRSWEYCYAFFKAAGPDGIRRQRDHAALHLGFYLASWGMYRGSSFLLQHDYRAHYEAVDLLSDERFKVLWRIDPAAEVSEHLHAPILALADDMRDSYRPYAKRVGKDRPTHTLLTKIMMGTLGCVPATDQYFLKGFRVSGYKFSALNAPFLGRIFGFCHEYSKVLREEQRRIEQLSGVSYPLMKLADMCFWQIGQELSESTGATERGHT